MKKIFVSGATGFIGSRLALRLAEEGNMVHALYRSEWKTSHIQHPNIKLFKGNIMDTGSLVTAIEGCLEVYHVAAFAKVWTSDPSKIYHLNIEGAMNVISAAEKAGVEKIVVTSTAGVLGSSGEGVIDEEAQPDEYFIDYEHSKAILESVLRTLSLRGIPVVIVNPSRVYGPGLLSESNGLTRIIKKYLEGKWRIIPGNGKSTGNYVFVEDVVDGHILAMEKGRGGESYILGGRNADFHEFFNILAEVSEKRYRLFHLPLSVMIAFSQIMLIYAKVFNRPPMLIPALARKYNNNFRLSTEKAKKELGYEPVSLKEGIEKTVKWLKEY